MIRDYALDSSEDNAAQIRRKFHETRNGDMRSAKAVARMLGYENFGEDTVLTPLGLRTLNNVSVVRDGVADKIVDEYGSLKGLLDDIEENPERVGDLGVRNPTILADSLRRMGSNRP